MDYRSLCPHLFGSETEGVTHSLPGKEPGSDQEGPDGVELHALVGLVPVHVPDKPGVLLHPGVDILVTPGLLRLQQREGGAQPVLQGGARDQQRGGPGRERGRGARGAALGQQRDALLVHGLVE